jgi:hypothetical protein
VLPLWLLRLIKIIMIVAALGWLIKRPKPIQPWVYLLVLNVTYICLLVAWDMSMTLKAGFGHGIQGRYFFPLIVSHMAFLVYGWSAITNRLSKTLILPLTLILFLALNIYSLIHVSSQYYNHNSIDMYSKQVSQYKPDLLKWPMPLLLFVAAAMAQTVMIYNFMLHRNKIRQ